ncbi:MAG TPA: LuxR C-terminal-related transcriptional regulator [Rhizomicrobium sp.]|jgi:DNA-binding CsgD family transcriptional regulator
MNSAAPAGYRLRWASGNSHPPQREEVTANAEATPALHERFLTNIVAQNCAAAAMWKRVIFYGVFLAAGTLALQWLDYQRLARVYPGDIYVFLIASAFLALGVFIGLKAMGNRRPAAFDGNPQAQAALRISQRELEVLKEIAAGRSTKEIAAELKVSPNTVKTHTARLFEKLGAKRRTDAIARAREVGIMP